MDPMVYPVLLLIAVLIFAVIAVIADGRNTRLRHRVEALSGAAEETAETVALNIRLARDAEHGLGWRIGRVLGVPVDMPAAQSTRPPWIIGFGLLLAAGLALVLDRFVGLAWPLAASGGLLGGVLFQRFVFGRQIARYQAALAQQLPDAIEMVVSAVRAGLPVGEAFRGVAEEMPSPTADEFTRVINEMAVGVAADKALLNIASRTRVTEYAIFAVTINVQTRSGGKLVESVQKLAETVRYRLAMMMRAQALAGEARVSAIILCSLPFVAGLGLSAIRPGYLDPLFNDPRGTRMLVIAVVGLLLGIFTMRQLIKRATAE